MQLKLLQLLQLLLKLLLKLFSVEMKQFNLSTKKSGLQLIRIEDIRFRFDHEPSQKRFHPFEMEMEDNRVKQDEETRKSVSVRVCLS